MIITNKTGLPQAFVEMAKRDYEYRDKRYSVTSLLKGVREAILTRRHHDEIEVDVADMIWMLFGQAAHYILEQQTEGELEFKENKLEVEIDGYTISGIFDLYDAKTCKITDYKTTSVWKIIFGDFDDWEKQLLIYAYMLRRIGFKVMSGEIVAILKDHSKREAKLKPGYPKLPVATISYIFGEPEFDEIEQFLINKVAEIKRCEQLTDDELPICTPEERFNSGDKYAVKKKGNKKATRVFDNLQDAEAFAMTDKVFEIEIRPGEDKKCIDYCSCNLFCNYYLENVVNRKEGTE